MLVLTRAVNEAIVIGGQIEITIIDVKGGKVRLGIQAPSSVTIHRKEVHQAIQEANREAAKAGSVPVEDLQRLLEERKRRGKGPGA
jgi:carbon storage regulator